MDQHHSQTVEHINTKKYFANTDGQYLMEKAKKLEKTNIDSFFRFVCMGKAMIDYAERGDLVNFKRLLDDSEDKELMYWHVTKGFKAAVKNRRVEIIEFVINELELSLNHETFQKYLHLYLFGCQEAEMESDEEGMELNREILKLLVKGKGKDGIDEVDNVNSSTPLIAACEILNDVELIKILQLKFLCILLKIQTVEVFKQNSYILINILVEGGADVNAVNTDDKMPLKIVKERLQNDMTNTKLEGIYDYLEGKGAKLSWKNPYNNY